MSAFANSPATAQSAPEGKPPQPVPSHEHRRPSRAKWWVLAAVLAAGTGAYVMTRPAQKTKPSAAALSIRTAKVGSGTLTRRLRVAGSTSARNFANIVAPMMRGPDAGRALVLIALAKSGSMVKKGEVIAEIDAQQIKDHVDDIQATIIQGEADIQKRK